MSKLERSSSKSSAWMSALVKFKGNKIGCLPILKDGTVDTDNKHVVVIPKKDAPDNIFEGKHVLKLNEDKDTIEGFSPYSGQHPAKFLKFGGKEGEDPAPKSEKGEYGIYYISFAIFEIIAGQYKGSTVTVQVPYIFEAGKDGKVKFTMSKGKFLERTEEFLDNVIGDFDPPEFTDNLLPVFQKMARKAKKTVGLVFKKGFVSTIVELDSDGGEVDPPWKQEPEVE